MHLQDSEGVRNICEIILEKYLFKSSGWDNYPTQITNIYFKVAAISSLQDANRNCKNRDEKIEMQHITPQHIKINLSPR